MMVVGVIAVFFTIGCLTTTTSAGNVGADRSQLMLYSEADMETSANNSYAQIIAEAKSAGTLNTNAATTNRVQAIAKKLIAQTGSFRQDALNWDWQVNVITESTINAWCMAGGKIVVYTGIIETLDLNDAQLAAVMGHEISHALREHIREQASRSALTSVGVSTLSQLAGFGTVGTTALELAAEYALTLPFSRSQETEADNIGTELMARAGYDPNEAVAVWEQNQKLEDDCDKGLSAVSGGEVRRIKIGCLKMCHSGLAPESASFRKKTLAVSLGRTRDSLKPLCHLRLSG